MQFKTKLKVLIALLVCAMAFTQTHAQTITGDINGTVTDAGGAVVAGANVTATNVDTGVAVSSVTNAAGVYSIRFLQIGNYTVTVQAKGFEQNAVGPFTLESGQIAKIDAKLTVGATTTTVQVSGNYAPLINAENGTVDTIVDTNAIENLPLAGNNFSSLTLFLPGAVITNPTAIDTPGAGDSIERSTNSNDLASINGGRLQQNDYLLDGIEVDETINNTNGYNPYPDALAEIRVISANAPAEFGNVNGGDVLMTIKSGTNAYHASASYSIQDYQLDANTWGNKHTTGTITSRTPYTQTIAGGTFGGPIIKDKLFFFVDYEQDRYHSGGVGNYTVLSQLMTAGNFSELLNPNLMCSGYGATCSNSKLTQLYDPESLNITPNAVTGAAAATYGAPFYNNIICGATSVATGYAQEATTPCANENKVFNFINNNPTLYPNYTHAAYAGVANSGFHAPLSLNSANGSNFTGPTSSHDYNNQGDAKVDWTPTKKDRMSFRWMMGTAGNNSTNPVATSFPGIAVYPDKGIAINWVRTFSPALINQATAGYSRIRWISGAPSDPSGAFGLTGDAKVGICATVPSCLPSAQPFVGFASQSNGLSSMGTAGSPTLIIDNTFQYADILTWQKEKHLFKFGAEFLRYQQNQFYAGNQGAMGIFTYNGNYSAYYPNIAASTTQGVTAAQGPYCATCASAGNSTVDWVLDRVQTDGIGAVTGNTGDRSWRSAYFAQDDWKVTPALTLNIGVRYEYVQPIYEVNGKQANVLPGGEVIYQGKLPASNLLPVSYNSTPVVNAVCPTRGCYTDPYNQISPRVGFAYQLEHNWVIRGGYGMTNYMEGTGANLRLFYNPPYTPSSILTGTAPTNTSPGLYFSESTQGFGAGTLALGGTTYRQWAYHMKPGVIGEYDLTSEYQLNNFSSIKVGYVGESGQHLIIAGAANQLAQPCINNTSGTVDGTAPGGVDATPNSTYCTANDPSPYQNLVSQAGGIVATLPTSMMNYNALQATFRQRASKGLEFTANYTYGRAMTNSIGFFGVPSISGPSAYAENFYNNHAEYGRVGQDVRNNFNATGIYELPFGRGHQFLSHDSLIVDEIIGGWKYSQTAIIYSGFPVTINAGSNNAYTNNKTQRANFVQKFNIVGRSLNNWWGTDATLGSNGTAAFSQPTIGTYGNSKVGTLSAPGYRQFDMSLFKTFTIYKQQKLAFRVNMYNMSNTASWSNPGNTEGSSSFGAITGVRNPQRQMELALHYNY